MSKNTMAWSACILFAFIFAVIDFQMSAPFIAAALVLSGTSENKG